MFGYMSADEARSNGFTNHGSYYGIPLWITDSDVPTVCTKWSWMEWMIDIAMHVEGFLFPIVHGADAEPCFMFKIGKSI